LNESEEHQELLKNGVRQPIASLTAVEVDTIFRAENLVQTLKQEIGDRPVHQLAIAIPSGAESLFIESRQVVKDRPEESGVLFLIDDDSSDDDALYRFWADMNLLRESWGSLECHVIFFLLPGSYRMLMQAADHLADWISLKLHIMGTSEPTEFMSSYSISDSMISGSTLTPKAARQLLNTLEPQLIEALENGLDKSLLVRRYYFPLFKAAVKLRELQRAKNLRKHISEEHIKQGELPEWWNLNGELDFLLMQLPQALEWVEKLMDWSKKTGHKVWESQSYNAMGLIAQEQQDFKAAEKWYRKTLEISEKQDNEYDDAGLGELPEP